MLTSVSCTAAVGRVLLGAVAAGTQLQGAGEHPWLLTAGPG